MLLIPSINSVYNMKLQYIKQDNVGIFNCTNSVPSDFSEEPVADIEGHAPYRVSRLAYHPSGRFLGTCW